MTSQPDSTWPLDAEHPSDATLLETADGEVTSAEAARVRAHLESCWSCRAKVERAQAAITAFVTFYEGSFTDAVTRPPHTWDGFAEALDRAAEQPPQASSLTTVVEFLRRSVARLLVPINGRRVSAAALRLAGVCAVIGVTALVFFRFPGDPRISASELLRRSQDADRRQLLTAAQPVVHQRLRVMRHSQAPGAAQVATWDVWHDPQSGRVHQVPQAASAEEVIRDLERVLRANRMDPRVPLSASSYQAWRRPIQDAEDRVTRATLPGDTAAFALHTRVRDASSDDAIVEATLLVRAADWHPAQESLRVGTAGAVREFTVVETAFDIVRLEAVASLFVEWPITAAVPVLPSGIASAPSPPVTPAFSELALDQMEMEVLHRLHRVGLCLPEEARITRSGRGLVVEGLASSAIRKEAITSMLRVFGDAPGTRVDVRVAPETAAEPLLADRSAADVSRTPLGAAVHRYIASRVGSTNVSSATTNDAIDDGVRQFVGWVGSRSARLLAHARALKALVERWPLRTLDRLGLDEVAAWQSMTGDHARAFHREAELLRTGLDPVVFKAISTELSPADMTIRDVSQVPQAVARLIELSESVDRVIRGGFTASGNADATGEFDAGGLHALLRRAEDTSAGFDVLWSLGR